MLVAQAMEESWVILSRDLQLGAYDVDVVRA
jgi:PIN domain nuclease of toxin-antitoxin system